METAPLRFIDNAALSNHSFQNTIANFHQGDVIDLTGLKFAPGASVSYSSATNTLKVSSNGVTDTLKLSGPVGINFKAVSDGHGGTEIVLGPTHSADLSLLTMFSAAAGSDPGSGAGPTVVTPSSVSSAENPLLTLPQV